MKYPKLANIQKNNLRKSLILSYHSSPSFMNKSLYVQIKKKHMPKINRFKSPPDYQPILLLPVLTKVSKKNNIISSDYIKENSISQMSVKLWEASPNILFETKRWDWKGNGKRRDNTFLKPLVRSTLIFSNKK